MPVRAHILFWLGTLVLLIGFVWLFKSILLPFVTGIAIAYLLEPVVERLAAHNISRRMAVFLILGIFILVVVALLLLLIPLFVRELINLSAQIPGFVAWLREMLAPYIKWAQDTLGTPGLDEAVATLEQHFTKAFSVGANVVAGIASGSVTVVKFVLYLILTPVVAYFFMMGWPNFRAWVNGLIPRYSSGTVADLIGKINTKISGFVRGQLIVCTVLGLFYAIILAIAGLNFGFLIGVLAGILSIIPLVGSTLGLVTSVGVAFIQTGGWIFPAIIAVIFLFGQVIETYFLSPKLLGEHVGMHPLWIIFAVMAGGALFGVVGMFLAVPVAASIGVLLNFAVHQYKASEYYLGAGGHPSS